MKSLFQRFGLPLTVAAGAGALLLCRVLLGFPMPGPEDLSRLAGSAAISIEGRVAGFPSTRWGRTRFVLEGRADPLSSYAGRTVVTLPFALEDLAPGDRVRVRGRLRGTRPRRPGNTFDERHYWASQGIYSCLRVYRREAFQRSRRSSFSAARAGWRFRWHFIRYWSNRLPPRPAAFLLGLTIGAPDQFPADLKTACMRAGVYHLVVVSGLHVSLIAGMALLAGRGMGVGRRRASWLVFPLIAAYALVVGASAPVLRAIWMALAAWAAFGLGRDGPRYGPIVLAAGVLMLQRPEALFGASFQLSFASTASLLAVLPLLEAPVPRACRRWRWLYGSLLTTLAVQIGTWPFLVQYFGQVSLSGIFANAALLLPTAALLVAGLVVGTFGVAAPVAVPEFLVRTIAWALEACLRLIAVAARPAWATVALPPPGWAVVALYYAGLCAILYVAQARRRSHASPERS